MHTKKQFEWIQEKKNKLARQSAYSLMVAGFMLVMENNED